jgi:hypothetical protein
VAVAVVRELAQPLQAQEFSTLVVAVVVLMLAAWHQLLLALALLAVEVVLLAKQQPPQQQQTQALVVAVEDIQVAPVVMVALADQASSSSVTHRTALHL